MDIRLRGVSVHEEENRRLRRFLFNRHLLLFGRRVVYVVRKHNSGLRGRCFLFIFVNRFGCAPAYRWYLIKLIFKVQLQLLVVIEKQDAL